MNDKILKVVNHYGILKQLKYMSTEQFELNETIIKFEDNSGLKGIDDITEELADNLFMLRQIQLYYDIDDEQIEQMMDYKIDRQLKRIEEENGN